MPTIELIKYSFVPHHQHGRRASQEYIAAGFSRKKDAVPLQSGEISVDLTVTTYNDHTNIGSYSISHRHPIQSRITFGVNIS